MRNPVLGHLVHLSKRGTLILENGVPSWLSSAPRSQQQYGRPKFVGPRAGTIFPYIHQHLHLTTLRITDLSPPLEQNRLLSWSLAIRKCAHSLCALVVVCCEQAVQASVMKPLHEPFASTATSASYQAKGLDAELTCTGQEGH